MATHEQNEESSYFGNIRPKWPYQSWCDVSTWSQNGDEQLSDTEYEESSIESTIEEPDHWLDDLDDDVSENCPIHILLEAVNSKNISCTPAAEEIRTEILPVMEKTLTKLTITHKVFKDAYLLPVGSMAENSKINKVDEFDFAVLLPVLANEDIFSLLLRKDSLLNDKSFTELISDLQCRSAEEVILNFAKCLKKIWLEEMLNHVSTLFEIQETPCYSDDVSVAGTFHLKRCKDDSIVDLDVCFWVPLDHEILSSVSDDLEQKEHLLNHCLDEHGVVYAILPRDEGIEHGLNSIRFATSCLERKTLLQNGPENNRLRCYRYCKGIVSKLVPKIKKRSDCQFCYEGLISSFCLKNIVLYLIENYKSDKFWTEEQLPNRVVEVFAILSLCMKINFQRVAAFFAQYEIQINATMNFYPEKSVVGKQSCPDGVKPCVLPAFIGMAEEMTDDSSKQGLRDYDQFLRTTEWNCAKVICRLTELLAVLRTEDDTEREELRKNAGWNEYGL